MTSTSAHGIARIAKTDNPWLRLAWTVMVIASVSFGLNNIFKTVTDYYQYDPITNIKTIAIKNFTFPTITICTKRIFTKEYFVNGSLVKKEITFEFSIKDFIDFSKSHFDGVPLNVSHLEYFDIPHRYGSCVRFNGLKMNETLTIKSSSEVLEVVFNINVSVSTSKFIQNRNSYFFYVKDYHFNSFVNTEKFRAKVGRSYFININKAYIEKKLGEPYNNCLKSLEKTYHQENCIDKCINRKIKNTYNCSIPGYYMVNDVEICQRPKEFNNVYEYANDRYTYFNNMDSIYGDYLEKLSIEFLEQCEVSCPKECESSKFGVQSQISTIDLGSSELYLSISDFSTLDITQIPKMSSFDLLSSIGGTLGLCIGISLLSFVEIFEFLFDVLLITLIER